MAAGERGDEQAAGRRERLAALETRLRHHFGDPALLETALTHRSYANEQGLNENYERLEFLGDAVLDLLTAEWLYRGAPEASEGYLTRRKSHLVSEPILARMADSLGLGELLRLGVGEARSGGDGKPSLLADVLEALIGALYLDGGLGAARRFVESLLEAMGGEGERRFRDAKSALQEYLQARGRQLPRYVLKATEGPDHAKHFTVECRVRGLVVGVGSGRSKKIAEQAAAEDALRRTEKSSGDEAQG